MLIGGRKLASFQMDSFAPGDTDIKFKAPNQIKWSTKNAAMMCVIASAGLPVANKAYTHVQCGMQTIVRHCCTE